MRKKKLIIATSLAVLMAGTSIISIKSLNDKEELTLQKDYHNHIFFQLH